MQFKIYTRKTPLAVSKWTSTTLIIFCQDKRKLRALDSPSPLQSLPRSCLHDTGATFAPEWVHSGSLSWLYTLNDTPQNVMPARVTPAWVHPCCCTGARISLRYEICKSLLSTTQKSTWSHPQRVYGRTGVRSRDYPNFSDG